MDKNDKIIEVKSLTVGYDDSIVLNDISFSVRRGEIFGILGGSGSGKSTILKHLIGLNQPISGQIIIYDKEITELGLEENQYFSNSEFGVLYQSGALFSTMSIIENVMLPLNEYTSYDSEVVKSMARMKLAMVGLSGFEEFYPHELSGGMKKRAAIARAMSLEPKLLFFDEPSAGLDPITSAELDELILNLKKMFGTTMVIVTHELDSIFAIADRVIVLDSKTKAIAAEGKPEDLKNSSNDWVKKFLTRSHLRG